MLRLPKPTPPPVVVSKPLTSVSYLYIVAVVFLVLWQLISLNTFVTYVSTYLNGKVDNTALVFALVLVAAEIFSLPFLLRLRLSPAARLCSAACVLVVPMVWAVLMLLNHPFDLIYIAVNAVAIVWGALAFWAMGGAQALTPKFK